jgi:hypothetical protein
MTEMGIAPGAPNFNADHSMGAIRKLNNRAHNSRRGKTRPAGSRVKLRRGLEKEGTATHTPISTRLLVPTVGSGEGPFRARPSTHDELLGCEN